MVIPEFRSGSYSLRADEDFVTFVSKRLRYCARSLAVGIWTDAHAEILLTTLLARGDRVAAALGRVVLQCYYRDDRVVRSLGLEPRPPYPKGHVLEQGDWSLLGTVRGRPRMWRDVDGKGS